MKFSSRVTSITPSSTLAITAKAKQLKAEGHDVIGLGAGEPDFNTPQYIIEASYKSMLEGHTKYTPAAGLPDLKKAVADKFKADQGIDYTNEEIIVTSGAKHSLSLLFQTILQEGEEVIIPTPYWVSYPEQVKIAGGNPVFVEGKEEHDFKVTLAQLEEAVTDKTKALIVNSPSNPTGVMYEESELKEIGDFCLKHNIVIVSDEIYEKLIYDGKKHVSIAQLSPELKEQTLIVNGVSKSHSMTGWRIGYTAGNKEIIKKMSNVASHTTSNPAVMSQYGAIAAYTEDDGSVEHMRTAFEDRLNKVYPQLNEIPGFSCVKPQGAFYLFPNVKEAVEKSSYDTTDDWVKALLEEEKVAVVPGSGFGAPDNIRLSYATSLDQIEGALERIKRFVEKHS
ncbi:pyridoxal phosphate-dependent aminotransferase [Salipaludibacillus sp. CUR1]|uniref:pyridoxal phosphate-dependent aminotransferase n=1 Tax=Salipaludibacillus sp. CUR1 TaxID=2820003 RepID=UPI001E532025|nr:pyridoxal phosphate-dependent aminotransferase [Salipaludibacillus sp. CUR1]MCE7792138.1 pyridoxal phosphate-dependent aminotransferase [Salipaludibacillus sp. CUR1]